MAYCFADNVVRIYVYHSMNTFKYIHIHDETRLSSKWNFLLLILLLLCSRIILLGTVEDSFYWKMTACFTLFFFFSLVYVCARSQEELDSPKGIPTIQNLGQNFPYLEIPMIAFHRVNLPMMKAMMIQGDLSGKWKVFMPIVCILAYKHPNFLSQTHIRSTEHQRVLLFFWCFQTFGLYFMNGWTYSYCITTRFVYLTLFNLELQSRWIFCSFLAE